MSSNTFIADFHMHSRFSRACSKSLTLPNNMAWCQIKGLDLITTADFTHPTWFKEISEQLEEVETGIYQLKKEFIDQKEIHVPESCQRPMKFFLTTEISLIYKKHDRVRKVHHVIMAPNLQTVAKINQALEKIGNIHSDGRPILGMQSKELLKLLLDISPDIELIPAHIWTPHFAIFGSKSGYDSLEECFEELTSHIHALETGLSSDPAMNWRLSQIDKYLLVSNSDAHSPQKMGREATVFNTEITYPKILHAIRNDHTQVEGTIEFFPQEGKYHYDGLRDEDLCLKPHETIENKFISPATGKKITVGVLHRVNDLATDPEGRISPNARQAWHIIPLPEILSEVLGTGPQSKRVMQKYFEIIATLGPEFYILKDCPLSDITAIDSRLGEAISRMRQGNVIINPGYDGVYGTIKLFQPQELEVPEMQASLF